MKRLKFITVALLLAGSLFLAGQAQAFAIYNDSDYEACVTKWYSLFKCYAKIPAHSKFNGEQGAGLDNVWLAWSHRKSCYSSKKFSIPKAGSLKIYNHVAKIYDRHDKQVGEVSIDQVDCPRLD